MSRNKENNPLSTATRPGSFASVTRNPPSDEFFTDSVLENSLIPSPSPQKGNPAKPRRAIGIARALQNAKDTTNRSRRPSNPENGPSLSTRQLQPAPSNLKKKSRSPLRTNGLSTPPRSRSLTTPSEFSSPPGGITDVYQRIADEEDLAATEREMESDDEDDLENGPQDTVEEEVDMPSRGDHIAASPSKTPRASRDVTPLRLPPDAEKENYIDDRVESLSEPATLDFVQNEMTDRVLAAKLTPFVVDRAKDRARLDKLRQSHIPIDFRNTPKWKDNQQNGRGIERNTIANLSKGPITFDASVNIGNDGINKASSDPSTESTPQKLKSFSRATRPGVKKSETNHDPKGDTPPEPQKPERLVAFSRATRPQREQFENETGEQKLLEPVPRLVAFSRANGRSSHIRAQSQEPEESQQLNGTNGDTVTSILSEPLPGAAPPSQKTERATRTFIAQWRQKTAQRRGGKSESTTSDDASSVDWAAAGADDPLPSVEKSSTPRDTPPRSAWPSTIQKQRSIDKIRKWENDFTGLSFQVSESPPIRNRPNLNDSFREREIENLAKQAVTTNRLGEIQEKDPNVLVRKSSRTFSPEERRQQQLKATEELPASQDGKSPIEGEQLAETPFVVHRSSSTSSKVNSSSKPSPSSQDSLNHLQRLARAVSTTPRASPILQPLITDDDHRVDNDKKAPKAKSDVESDDLSPGPQLNGKHRAVASKVAETPKVVGAWTDTILPDTVKTARQQEKVPKYLETPHVNAGAWIDTPIPNGTRLPSVPIPTTIEEVTEDLTNGALSEEEKGDTAKGVTAKSNGPIREVRTEEANSRSTQPIVPQSALANVLNEAKQKRLVSKNVTDLKEDTLNLGDATIQSFEDLLTDAADVTADLTNFIKAGAEDEFIKQRQLIPQDEAESGATEVAFIGHLTSRMERLMSNLHEARKGISRLEQKVAYSPVPNDEISSVTGTSQGLDQLCSVCGQASKPQTHNCTKTDSWIPMVYSIIALPIPLLFYPRRKDHPRILPRPTLLGWLTMIFWTWYVLECIMCEFYARPLYAEWYVWPTEPEPEFPFVLPTMLFRWTRFNKLAPGLWRVLIALYRMTGMMFGFSDGFVDDALYEHGSQHAANVVADTTKAALNAARSLLPGAGGEADLSMMNDEFI